MMHWKQAWLASCVGSLLTSWQQPAQAQVQERATCRDGHAVALTIQLQPTEVSELDRLQQRVAAELRARDLDVCPAAPGQGRVAHVLVSASLPGLSPTRVQVHTDAGATLERNLDLSSLPREARPSAIASATDELLATLLQDAAASPAASEPAAKERDAGKADVVVSPPAAWRLPWLELGLGGGAALFAQRGKAYGGELLARWRPLSRVSDIPSRLSATLRAGGGRGSVTDPAFFDYEEQSRDWHAALDAGFELLEPGEGLGLAAQAGLGLARIRRTERQQVPTPVGAGRQSVPLGSSWEVAANVGGEVSFRTGPWGASLGLYALVPFTPWQQSERAPPGFYATPGATSEPVSPDVFNFYPPHTGFGEKLGVGLDLRLWVALGS